jgi:hypothetical protein
LAILGDRLLHGFFCHLVAEGGICKTKKEIDNKAANFFQPRLANLGGSNAGKKVIWKDFQPFLA